MQTKSVIKRKKKTQSFAKILITVLRTWECYSDRGKQWQTKKHNESSDVVKKGSSSSRRRRGTNYYGETEPFLKTEGLKDKVGRGRKKKVGRAHPQDYLSRHESAAGTTAAIHASTSGQTVWKTRKNYFEQIVMSNCELECVIVLLLLHPNNWDLSKLYGKIFIRILSISKLSRGVWYYKSFLRFYGS